MGVVVTTVRQPEGQALRTRPLEREALAWAVREIRADLAPEGRDDLVASGCVTPDGQLAAMTFCMLQAAWSYVLWDDQGTPLGLVGADIDGHGVAHTFMVYRPALLGVGGVTAALRAILDEAQAFVPGLVIVTRSLLGLTVTPAWMQGLGFLPTGETSPSDLLDRVYVHFQRRASARADGETS